MPPLVTKTLRDLLVEILGGGVSMDDLVERIKDSLEENELRAMLRGGGNQLCEVLHEVGNRGLKSGSALTVDQSIDLMTRLRDSVTAQLSSGDDQFGVKRLDHYVRDHVQQ